MISLRLNKMIDEVIGFCEIRFSLNFNQSYLFQNGPYFYIIISVKDSLDNIND